MFRILELAEDGRVSIHEGDANVAPPPPGILRWIDLDATDAEALELLRERFGLHPLAIEDCLHLDQRPKLEEYGDHLFLVTQSFTCTERVEKLQLHELHSFLGPRWLITVRGDPIPALESVFRRLSTEAKPMQRGADFVYYLIADALVDSNFPIIDRLADEIEELEDRVLMQPTHKDLARIFELKRHLVTMRRVLSPQRDTIAMVMRSGLAAIDERSVHYFRDVFDHLTRINESLENNRDLLGSVLDAYLSSASNRTNAIMKSLTLLSAVFLPLAFVVGFFGQNFHNLPLLPNWMGSDSLMFVVVGICLATPIGMGFWFWRKRWL